MRRRVALKHHLDLALERAVMLLAQRVGLVGGIARHVGPAERLAGLDEKTVVAGSDDDGAVGRAEGLEGRDGISPSTV